MPCVITFRTIKEFGDNQKPQHLSWFEGIFVLKPDRKSLSDSNGCPSHQCDVLIGLCALWWNLCASTFKGVSCKTYTMRNCVSEALQEFTRAKILRRENKCLSFSWTYPTGDAVLPGAARSTSPSSSGQSHWGQHLATLPLLLRCRLQPPRGTRRLLRWASPPRPLLPNTSPPSWRPTQTCVSEKNLIIISWYCHDNVVILSRYCHDNVTIMSW